VKNALVAQKNRSLFQKLKEAALAYRLERSLGLGDEVQEAVNRV
jgi:membrane peptidoglycan carboxypeptidase